MDLSIIIVNYNTLEITKNCLRSIYENTKHIDFEIILVDNASIDNSATELPELFPQVRYIWNQENLGFAKANNKGVKLALADEILLLNSDTLIIGDCLKRTLEFSKQNSTAGIIGCKVLNKDKTLQYSCFHEPTLLTEVFFFTINIIKGFQNPITNYRYMKNWDHNQIKEVDSISGCYFWVKKNVFEKIGLLDENIFMYYEDTEFCRRMQTQTLFRIVYFPEIQIIHLGGGSALGAQKINSIKICFKAARYYFRKCKGVSLSHVFVILCKMIWALELIVFSLLIFNPLIRKKYILIKEMIK